MPNPIESAKPIRVGLIGASPLNPGWAVAAHVPAIRALPADFTLQAVSTSRPESARAAEAAWGVTAFSDPRRLIEHPDVDLVVVAVRVPGHHGLVASALEAGKPVLCEWPLGADLREACELAERARISGVRTFIGLQARYAPALRRARQLLDERWIGDVLGTTLVGSGIAWGGVTDGAHAYLFDQANGATTLTVPALHAIDALCHLLGEPSHVSAALAVRRATVHVADEGRDIGVSAPDQAAILLRLQSGAIASVHYRGGVSRGENLRWEINGSEGDLVITSSVGNVQVAPLALAGGRGGQARVEPLSLAPRRIADEGDLPDGPAANVARLYAAIGKDMRQGTATVPDFEHALRRHRLIAQIEAASPGHVMA